MTTSTISTLSTYVNYLAAYSQAFQPTLVGYWHNWHTETTPFIPLREIAPAYDVIHIAFAISEAARDGAMIFAPCEQTSPTEFKADLAYLQKLGKKVSLSVGGANGSVAVDSPARQRKFVDSLERLVNEYGFDGLDLDMEGTVCLDPGDVEIRQPTSASIIYFIRAIRELRRRLGKSFTLSLAPQVISVQGGYSAYQGFQGAYLPVIDQLRDVLDYVYIQIYNTSAHKALDGQVYKPEQLDFHLAMTEMLLTGFSVAGQFGHYFAPLRPEQVGLGLPAAARIVQNGYLSPAEMSQVVACLANGQVLENHYRLRNPAGYPGFQRLMTWSINWDAVDGLRFSSAARATLENRPACFAG